MVHVVTKLIFFLVAENGKCSDGGDELIVAEGFESRNGSGCGAKGKGEGKAKIGIARLRKMQKARTENESALPGWAERILIAEGDIQIIVVRGGASRGKRSLLNERVARYVAIGGGAKKPMRRVRLSPVEAK